MRCPPLASGAPWGAAFPPRSSLAPQSRRRRAPSARSRCVPRSPPGRLGAPPSLLARSSLVSPGGTGAPSARVQAAPRPSSSLMPWLLRPCHYLDQPAEKAADATDCFLKLFVVSHPLRRKRTQLRQRKGGRRLKTSGEGSGRLGQALLHPGWPAEAEHNCLVPQALHQAHDLLRTGLLVRPNLHKPAGLSMSLGALFV